MPSPTLLFLTFVAGAVLLIAWAPEYVSVFIEYYKKFRSVVIPAAVFIIAWVLLGTQSLSAILLAGFMVVVLVLGLYDEYGDNLPF